MAVLPFANLGRIDEEYVAEGIADAIRTRLSRFDRPSVIGRASSVRYKDSDKTPQSIAEELSVSHLLSGTIQRERPSPQSLEFTMK